jgi:hypothetical protein
MIHAIERFSFASALDLNMGYYIITSNLMLIADGQNICTIVFPWHMEKIKLQTLTQ